MRFSSVLAVVAAFTVSISAMPSTLISASEANTENCPVFCLKDSDCFGCSQLNCYAIFCYVHNAFEFRSDSSDIAIAFRYNNVMH
ncbi:hypothetical protein BD769DRAFT_563958 [Suillus cothurnatus]|nr:hypothetical protein BD769DRAFT_563958 [Suillus cothurnatus]